MAVRLEFLTQNPEEMELAIRYWATDKEGAFLERVADLVPFREIIQSGQIAKKYVSTASPSTKTRAATSASDPYVSMAEQMSKDSPEFIHSL